MARPVHFVPVVLLGLAALPIVPQGVAADEDPWPVTVLTDARGDTPHPALDIVGVDVMGEDSRHLTLQLRLAQAMQEDTAPTLLLRKIYTVSFSVAESPLRFEARLLMRAIERGAQDASVEMEMTAANQMQIESSELCIEVPDCRASPLPASFDAAASSLAFVVAKSALMGRDPQDGSQSLVDPRLPPHLPAATVLHSWRATSEISVTADDAGDASSGGTAYPLRVPAANDVVRLSLRTDTPGLRGANATVTPGFNTSVVFVNSLRPVVLTFDLWNAAPGPRDLRIRTDIDDRSRAEGWIVRAPATAVLEGESGKDVVVILHQPDPDLLTSELRLRVDVTSLGSEKDVARWDARVYHNGGLSPASNVLYAHASTINRGLFGSSDVRPWLSTSRDDLLANRDQAPYPSSMRLPQETWELVLWTRAGLPGTVRLTPDAPGLATIAFVSRIPTQLEVAVDYHAGDVSLGRGTTTSAVGTEPTEVTFEVPLNAPPELTPGTPLGVRIVARSPDPQFQATHLGGLKIQLTSTSFEWPVAAKPGAQETKGFVGLEALGTPDEFVNPGEARKFRFLLVSQAPERDIFEVVAGIDAVGWTLDILPSPKYELDPSDAIVFDVLARAPEGARDGDQGELVVRVQSELLSLQTVTLRHSLTVTGANDLPDDSLDYAPDDAALAKGISDGRTPSVSLLATLGALGVGYGLVRRRGRGRPGPGGLHALVERG